MINFSEHLFHPPKQPAEEISKEREEEKVKEIQEDQTEEAAKRETKEVQTNELKSEKTSQKAAKKTKTVPCKVILLDGTEYCCDLEVSQGPEEHLSWCVEWRQSVICLCGAAQWLYCCASISSCNSGGYTLALEVHNFYYNDVQPVCIAYVHLRVCILDEP